MTIRPGFLTVYTGPMGASKTARLIEHYNQARLLGATVVAIQPRLDTRTKGEIRSRLIKDSIESIIVETPKEFILATMRAKFIAIDEAQFLSNKFLPDIVELLNRGNEIAACGLDTDLLGRPFGIMPQLMAMADECEKLKGICLICKARTATRTQLTIPPHSGKMDAKAYQAFLQPVRDFIHGKSHALIGDFGLYESRCPKHHNEPILPLEE